MTPAFYRSLLALSVLLFFVLASPALAYSDHFDSDISDDGWALTGSWSTSTTDSYDGGYYAFTAPGVAGTSRANYTVDGTATYWQIYMNASLLSGSTGSMTYVFKGNSTSINPGNLCTGSPAKELSVCFTPGTGEVYGYGFTFTTRAYGGRFNKGVRFVITETGNNIRVRTYNATGTNFTLMDDQTGAITTQMIGTNRIEMQAISYTGSNINAKFDDIEALSTSPDAGDSISFDADSYAKDGVATVTWTISNSVWNLFYTHRVEIDRMSDGAVVQKLEGVPQTGSLKYQWTVAGAYTAYLIQTIGICPLCIEEILASDQASVYDTLAYITGPDLAYVGQNVSISYGMNEQFTRGNIERCVIDANGVCGIPTTYFSIPAGQTGTTNISFPVKGKYELRLWNWDIIKLEAKKSITVQDSGASPNITILNDVLTLDNSVYSTNDWIIFNYAVNSSNWAIYNVFYVYAQSASGLPMGSVNLPDEAGSGTLILSGGSWLSTVQTGAAFVNLSAKTDFLSGEKLLVSVPITIQAASVGGFNLSVFPQEICKEDKLYIKYVAPTAANLVITYQKNAGGPTNETTPVIGSGQMIKYWNPAQIMDRSLIAVDLKHQANGTYITGDSVIYKKTECTPGSYTPPASPTATTTPPPSSSEAVSNVGTNLTKLIGQPFFWGLIFLIFFAIALYKGNFIDNHRGVAIMAFAFIEALMGLFDPYKLTIIAVIIILAAIGFKKGQDTVSGG